MFKVFTASDFSDEINKALSLTSYSVQMLIDVKDLQTISKSIFRLSKDDIQVEIILSTMSKSKSLFTMNAVNRLIESGANVYWNDDQNIFDLQSYFFIGDKTNVINNIFYINQDSPKEQILYFLSIFQKIKSESQQIVFNNREIQVIFEVNNIIVEKNRRVKLNWDVKNADTVEITPIIGSVRLKDEIQIQLEEDTQFKLEAQNSNESVIKFLFVKVIEPDYFSLTVKVFDPVLNEHVFLEAKNKSSIDCYACYYSQDVTLSIYLGNSTNVFEDEIGLINQDIREISFKALRKKMFVFRYLENDLQKIKKIEIVPFNDRSLLEYFDQ